MSPLRWTLLGLFLLTAFVVASLTAKPSEWGQTVQWARQWRDAAAKSPAGQHAATCPVLVGDPLPGDPRTAYELAGSLAAGVARETRDRLHMLSQTSSVSAATSTEALALVAELPAAALDELRRSVRMAGTMYAAEELGRRLVGNAFGDQEVLVDALLVLARHATSETERVAAWLDALACGWDRAGKVVLVERLLGVVMVSKALDVADEQWLDTLSDVSLQQLRDALAAVDQATPLGTDLQSVVAHLVLMVSELPDLQVDDLGLVSIYQLWQNGFSVVDAGIERAARLAEQVRNFEQQAPATAPWPQRRAALQQLVAADKLCNSDMRFGYLGFASEAEQNRRESITRMRFLRLALACRLGESLQLDDPLGSGPLGMVRDGAKVRFFSAEPGCERIVVAP